jgi:DNA-binding GntR family transcriptional regulator
MLSEHMPVGVKGNAVSQSETVLPSELFMDLERSGPSPLYFQVATRLEKAIGDGTLPAGARLENEIALGTRLGVSRPTIRRAIQDLVDKGLLVRRRGVGTQVVHGQVSRKVDLTSLYEDLAAGAQNPRTQVLTHELVPADKATAAALLIEPGSPVLRLRRLRLADSTPVAILENFLPEEFAGITVDELTNHGLYQVMRGRGTAMSVAKQRIGARRAVGDEAALLEIDKGGPLLTMERTVYDNSGHAVEVGRHCYRPDLYSFEITLVDR